MAEQHVVRSLKLIGYWRSETDPSQDEWPDVTDFVDPGWDPYERLMVIRYLYSGWDGPFCYAGFSLCRICHERNGSQDRTDGVYLWPEGLGHYVAEHSVRLPGQVVDHIRRQVDGRAAAVATSVDGAWWRTVRLDWTAQGRLAPNPEQTGVGEGDLLDI